MIVLFLKLAMVFNVGLVVVVSAGTDVGEQT